MTSAIAVPNVGFYMRRIMALYLVMQWKYQQRRAGEL